MKNRLHLAFIVALLAAITSSRAQQQQQSSQADQTQITAPQHRPTTGREITRSTTLTFVADASAAEPSTASAVATPMQNLDPFVRKQIDDFFTTVEKHQIDIAYDQLVKGTKIAERSEEVSTLKSKTQQAISLFGDFSGHEIVGAKGVGTHLIEITCLSLGSDYPLRWRFYYYNANDTWRLIDIRVDDRLTDMFGEPQITTDQQSTTTWPRQQQQLPSP